MFCKYTGALYQSLSTERFALVAFGDLKISINYSCLLYIHNQNQNKACPVSYTHALNESKQAALETAVK